MAAMLSFLFLNINMLQKHPFTIPRKIHHAQPKFPKIALRFFEA